MVSYEDTVVYLVSIYQYLVTCVAFSISKPFKQPFYTNYWFTGSLLTLGSFNVYSTFYSHEWLLETFEVSAVVLADPSLDAKPA